IRAICRDTRLLHFVAIYFLIQTSGYGVAFYLPTQVSALVGVKMGFEVGLLTAVPWACAIVVCSFWPALAVRKDARKICAVISLLAITVGLSLSAWLPPAWAIAALCLTTAGIISAQPIFWTFPTNYLGGIAAAAGIATINALGNVGGLVAPNVKTALEQA